MKNAAVIVAAGRGSRLGNGEGPKQYQILGSQSVLQTTIDCFVKHNDIHTIQVVIHREDIELYKRSIKSHPKLLPPVPGGNTRQASCKAGVEALAGEDIDNVLIHDAARPFLGAETINKIINGISAGVCSLPATAIADTIKKADADGFVEDTINRDNLYLAQTPQGFVWQEILEAHKRAEENTTAEFTDDAAVAEWAGLSILLVEGDRNNFKITTPNDLEIARAKVGMTGMMTDVRTGNGYDVHTLGPGSSVVLCGVDIPHSQSLQGHSDADVGLHALTDALLGTIGEGDIGSHFPPSDPKWKGASSDQFLRHATALVTNAGGTITNLDVTIICEAPKIGPYRDLMRQRICEICDLDLSRVSVKATTNERIGFIGREEGIAALASASVCIQEKEQS